MDHYQETFQTWNKIAQLYEDQFMSLAIYDESYDLLLTEAKNTQVKVLDIACGPGNISKYLLNQNTQLQITGIDIAPNMLTLARRNNPKGTYNVMDLRDLDQLAEQYDLIIGGFCLPYCSKKVLQKLVHDCKKIAKSQALLYLSFVEGEYRDDALAVGSTGDRTYFFHHERSSLQVELAQADFRILHWLSVPFQKSEELKKSHTILIAQANT